MDDGSAALECLDRHEGDCEGPVEYHTTGQRLKAFPRCRKHQQRRQERYENSIEREAESATPPEWFDPSYAGERWEEDY